MTPYRPEEAVEDVHYRHLFNRPIGPHSLDLLPSDAPTRNSNQKLDRFTPDDSLEDFEIERMGVDDNQEPAAIDVAADKLIQCINPTAVAATRLNDARRLAESTLMDLLRELSEVLLNFPEAPYYEYPCNIPSDCLSLLIASMRAAGWTVNYHPAKLVLIIELPAVDEVAPPLIDPRRSRVTPL